MNRPVLKEHYIDPQVFEKHVIDVIESQQKGLSKQEQEQRKHALETYNRAMEKVANRSKKTKFSDDELAARLDMASLQESHLYRQAEALGAFQQQNKAWGAIDEKRDRVLQKNREYENNM